MAETIQSVDRALEVLIYLEAADQETSITKMASDMGVYKSTIYRTLATLEARGFVRKNPDTDRYWLGNRLFSLGKSVENTWASRRWSVPLPESCMRPTTRR